MVFLGVLFGTISLIWSYVIIVDPNFYYSIDLPVASAGQLINEIKSENKELITPPFTINGNTYTLPAQTEGLTDSPGRSHFNIFNVTDSTFYHVYLSEDEE